ncbi:LacI family DNA-binding transcriptional regulator [Clostridium sp. AN503]|uniref:LacI family DNA-binding transcriptional regulator n=1 Tax=Clostridium sp. AN503 TaxID=3160598 RepID=UPI00345A3FFA
MNKSSVTIYDIAKEANASPATVSRVLNNSQHPVKQEMRDRILETSRRMGYIPNLQARNLKSQKSTSIGIIIPSIANPFYPSIVRGIEDEIVSRNYHMIISSCDRDIERTNYSIENMLAVNVQGIISIYMDAVPEGLWKLVERGSMALNVVANGKCLPGMHTILVDKVEECKIAVRYLLEQGHKKIAILFDRLDNSIRTNRLTGYQEALKENGIEYCEDFVYILGRDADGDVTESSEKGYLLARAMLNKTPEVTAFVCMNDAMTLGALKAVREANKLVPGDYSVISFDDLVFADSVYPALTTVGLDKYQWGRKLAQYYFDLMDQPDRNESVVTEKEVLITSELIIRQSVKKIL